MADVIGISLVGANPTPIMSGSNRLPGVANYLSDTGSLTGVATYGRVQDANVYPGVNLVYHGENGQLEYDFDLAPGADPGRIQLEVQGGWPLTIDRSGALAIHLDGENLVQEPPRAYQIEAQGHEHAVAVRYLLHGNRVAFALAGYDPSLPLVIDPTLAYSTYLGGSSAASVGKGTVDPAGNAYITGGASSTFPTTPGAYQRTATQGGTFVAKLNTSGSALVYSTFIDSVDAGTAIAVDSTGSAYVMTTRDMVIKLNSSGSSLDYSTTVSGGGAAIAVDAAGDAYVTGNRPGGGVAVIKLDASGSVAYSVALGGGGSTASDSGYGIAVDSAGNAYVTGVTFSATYPTTQGAFQTTSGSGTGSYLFVTKVDPTGGLVYSTFVDGSKSQGGDAVAVDSAGDAYVTGSTSSPDFPTTPCAYRTTFSGSGSSAGDAVVFELNPSGSALVYSTFLGGGTPAPGVDGTVGLGIAVDPAGDAYIGGDVGVTGFPTTSTAVQSSFAGGQSDGFVSELNPGGSELLYSTYLGGSGGDTLRSIAIDSAGNAYVAGITTSTDFPTTQGALQTAIGPGSDGFVSELALAVPASTTATTVCVSTAVYGYSNPITATVTPASAAYTGGTPTGTVQFAIDGSPYGAPVAVSGGRAVIDASSIPVGSHMVTATYSGDAQFSASSGPMPSGWVVTPAPSTVTLTENPTSIVTGQSVTFTVVVGPVSPGIGTPTGTVTVPGVGSGTLAVVNGVDQATVTGPQFSSASIATYGGDANFTASSSPAVSETVSPADTTVSVSSSLNPTFAGNSTEFTATVAGAAPGSGTPTTGVVTFRDGTATAACVGGPNPRPLDGSPATCIVGYSAAGNHSVTATYSGNGQYNASTSAVFTQVVQPFRVAVTLHSHALAANGSATTQVYAQLKDANGNNLADAGDLVTFTSDSGLTFTDLSGATLTNSAVTDAGGFAAVKVIASTHAGSVVITATSADTQTLSGSDTLKLTGSHFASARVASPQVFAGSSTAVSALVVDGSGTPVAGETVDFSSPGNTVTPSAVTDGNGLATATLSSLTPGTHTVTATDPDFAVSPSTTLIFTQLPATAADNASFVHNAYVTLLGHDADPGGFSYWLGALDAGTPRSVLATTLARSSEYRTDVIGGAIGVEDFYHEYLGRPSDPGGVAYWVSQMAGGVTFEQVRLQFVGSPEYFAYHNSDPSQTIDALYNDVLGRSDATDPAGKAYWMTHFNVNTIAAQFLYSTEGRAHLVAGYYRSILNRAPDAAGLAYWTQAILQGASDEDIIGFLVGSEEYLLSH